MGRRRAGKKFQLRKVAAIALGLPKRPRGHNKGSKPQVIANDLFERPVVKFPGCWHFPTSGRLSPTLVELVRETVYGGPSNCLTELDLVDGSEESVIDSPPESTLARPTLPTVDLNLLDLPIDELPTPPASPSGPPPQLIKKVPQVGFATIFQRSPSRQEQPIPSTSRGRTPNHQIQIITLD